MPTCKPIKKTTKPTNKNHKNQQQEEKRTHTHTHKPPKTTRHRPQKPRRHQEKKNTHAHMTTNQNPQPITLGHHHNSPHPTHHKSTTTHHSSATRSNSQYPSTSRLVEKLWSLLHRHGCPTIRDVRKQRVRKKWTETKEREREK